MPEDIPRAAITAFFFIPGSGQNGKNMILYDIMVFLWAGGK